MDKDFTGRLQSVEERLENQMQDLREFYAMLQDIGEKFNALIDKLEKEGMLKEERKIVSIN